MVLEETVCAPEIKVCVEDGESGQRPWSARIGVWIHELRVCDQEDMMRLRLRTLQDVSECCCSTLCHTYPSFPVGPSASAHTVLKYKPFSPPQSEEPDDRDGKGYAQDTLRKQSQCRGHSAILGHSCHRVERKHNRLNIATYRNGR